MSKVVKRIKIGLKDYERVVRKNLNGDYLYYKKIAGKKRGSYCYAYFRDRTEEGGPVAIWESTGHGWVWSTWDYPTFFKKLLTKVLG